MKKIGVILALVAGLIAAPVTAVAGGTQDRGTKESTATRQVLEWKLTPDHTSSRRWTGLLHDQVTGWVRRPGWPVWA
jgi:hypothetical protein